MIASIPVVPSSGSAVIRGTARRIGTKEAYKLLRKQGYVTIAEAARRSGYTYSAVQWMIANQHIRATRVSPARWVVHLQDVLERARTSQVGRKRTQVNFASQQQAPIRPAKYRDAPQLLSFVKNRATWNHHVPDIVEQIISHELTDCIHHRSFSAVKPAGSNSARVNTWRSSCVFATITTN